MTLESSHTRRLARVACFVLSIYSIVHIMAAAFMCVYAVVRCTVYVVHIVVVGPSYPYVTQISRPLIILLCLYTSHHNILMRCAAAK